MNAKVDAARWAKNTLEAQPLFLDTETTGLQDTGEVVQISVIDMNGHALIDTLVKPARLPIPVAAMNVHGITDQDVADAPRWSEVVDMLLPLLTGRLVVIYNADYDTTIMQNSANFSGMRPVIWGMHRTVFTCAMQQYARYWGDWSDWHQSYKWQKLTDACYQLRIPDIAAPAHSALGDCLRTLAVVNAMAAYQPTKVVRP